MRVSIRKDDPGYFRGAWNCRVLVDGQDVSHICYTADEEEGRAYCYALNERGERYKDPLTQEPALQVLHGEVEIIVQQNGSRVDV